MKEIIRPQRSLPQPNPGVRKGGDCWACVIGGMTGLSVAEVYTDLNEGNHNASLSCIPSVLYAAMDKDLVQWFYDETPYWPSEHHREFGDPAIIQRLGWISWVHMALGAGYVGYASVSHNGLDLTKEYKDSTAGYIGGRTNHAVMICGIRKRLEPHKTMKGCNRILHDILVSCSASHPDGKWIEVDDFLINYGGFNPIWVMCNE